MRLEQVPQVSSQCKLCLNLGPEHSFTDRTKCNTDTATWLERFWQLLFSRDSSQLLLKSGLFFVGMPCVQFYLPPLGIYRAVQIMHLCARLCTVTAATCF